MISQVGGSRTHGLAIENTTRVEDAFKGLVVYVECAGRQTVGQSFRGKCAIVARCDYVVIKCLRKWPGIIP